MKTEDGEILSHVILREIPIETQEIYYGLVTPYGYGSSVILSRAGDKERLLAKFRREMKKFVEKL